MKDWNEQLQIVNSSNLNYQIYNAKLAKIKAKIHKAILFNEDESEMITSTEIIELVKGIDRKKLIALKQDILRFGKEHILQLQSTGNIGNAICYSCAVNKLQSFVKKNQLLFEEVNYKFLEKFRISLLTEGLKVNSIALYLRTIRALFRRAIKEETLEAKHYPFINFKLTHETTINRTLTILELKVLFIYRFFQIVQPGITEIYFYYHFAL